MTTSFGSVVVPAASAILHLTSSEFAPPSDGSVLLTSFEILAQNFDMLVKLIAEIPEALNPQLLYPVVLYAETAIGLSLKATASLA